VWGDVGVNPAVSDTASLTEVEPILFLDGGKKVWSATTFGEAARVAHATAFAAPADARVLPAAIGGSTFTPGTYIAAAAVGIA
jgi:hypothetical protein